MKTGQYERRCCKYYHIDCGKADCWAIKETDAKILPCPHEGDLQRCFDNIVKEFGREGVKRL